MTDCGKSIQNPFGVAFLPNHFTKHGDSCLSVSSSIDFERVSLVLLLKDLHNISFEPGNKDGSTALHENNSVVDLWVRDSHRPRQVWIGTKIINRSNYSNQITRKVDFKVSWPPIKRIW